VAAKKYYAVKIGKIPGIYSSWEECKANVDGFPGAVYKGFAKLEEAENFLGQSVNSSIQETSETDEKVGMKNTKRKKQDISAEIMRCKPSSAVKLVAYVDGSYEHSLLKYAFGCVFIMSDGNVYTVNGSGNDPETAKQRNVAGEMLGAMYAARFALKNGFQELEIRYDYEGIQKWVTGEWRAKTELTGKYSDYMRKIRENMSISFTKVAAHTNVCFNEMADLLAKDGLLLDTGVPKVYDKEELTPWQVSE